MTPPHLTSIELFAGIGGFSSPAITPIALVEKEPTCRAVLRRHHPDALILEDVRDVGAHNLPWANVIKFGFPCFPAGTLILTHAGLVPIEDVREGDLVLTHTGRWRPIIQTMRRMAPTIRLRGHGHPALVTTEEHPFWATSQVQQWVPRSPEHPNGTFRRDWRSPDWIAAKDMQGKYWASPTDFPAQGVPPFIRNLRERFVCEQNDAFFWIVGAWLGDGWLNMRQRAGRPDGQTAGQVFICTDHREVEELQRRLDAAGLTYTISPEQTTTKFIVSSRPLARWLHEHFGQYAHGKRVPAWALGMAEPLRAALLAGYTWADGSKLGDKTRATSISKGLLIGMKLLAQSLGYSVALHTYVTNRVAVIEGRIVVERPQWQLVSEERGKSSVVFGPHRFGRVRAVEPTGEIQEVFNIGVADDESYVADGIVVHNCQDLSVAGKRAGLAGGRSGLFFEATRIIEEMQPEYIIFENVPGLLSGKYEYDEATYTCICGWSSGWRRLYHSDEKPQAIPLSDSLHRNERKSTATQSKRPDGVKHDRGNTNGEICFACGRAVGASATRHVQRTWMGDVLGELARIRYFGAWTVLDAQFFGVAQRRRRVFGVFARRDIGVERCTEILSLATRLRGHSAPSSEARPDVAATIRTSSSGDGVNRPGRRGDDDINIVVAEPTTFDWQAGVSPNDRAWLVDPPGRTRALTANRTLAVFGGGDTSGERGVAATLTVKNQKNDFDTENFVVASTLNSGGNRGGFRTEPGEHLVAVTFEARYARNGRGAPDTITAPLKAETGKGDGAPLVSVSFAQNQRGELRTSDTSSQLTTGGGKPGQGYAAALTQSGVRRLTPTECERLQGFEDGWTAWGIDEQGQRVEMTDSVRYRMCGNAVCKNVSAWIDQQILRYGYE